MKDYGGSWTFSKHQDSEQIKFRKKSFLSYQRSCKSPGSLMKGVSQTQDSEMSVGNPPLYWIKQEKLSKIVIKKFFISAV